MNKLAKLLSVLAFLGGAAILHAQTAPAKPVVASAQEMTLKAAGLQSQIQDDNRHVLFLKEQAKKAKDVIKLSCVNDKIVQIKAEMNIADSTNDQLQVALQKNSDDRVGLFTQLQTAADAVKRLREEAAVCLGEPELYKQEAGQSFTAPQVPDDPTVNPLGGGELEPPAYASPYR
jgi:hypothetical protein